MRGSSAEYEHMLLDHFQPPLKGRRHWTGFHSRWAGNIAVDINRQLPTGWFAEPTVHWGVEIDVAAFEEAAAVRGAPVGGVASWEPPTPLKTIDFAMTTDVVEVQVYRDFGDVPLVAAVELVSPANKDRPETRDAFVSKCDSCLRDGIGLVIVDVVSVARANLHSLLMHHLGETDDPDDWLYAASYRPVPRDDAGELTIWYEPLRIGGSLSVMPLYLKNGPRVRVNLAETYQLTCEELRVPGIVDHLPADSND